MSDKGNEKFADTLRSAEKPVTSFEKIRSRNQFRRLRLRYDKRPDIHEAFLSLGCALICWQSLRKTWSAA